MYAILRWAVRAVNAYAVRRDDDMYGITVVLIVSLRIDERKPLHRDAVDGHDGGQRAALRGREPVPRAERGRKQQYHRDDQHVIFGRFQLR